MTERTYLAALDTTLRSCVTATLLDDMEARAQALQELQTLLQTNPAAYMLGGIGSYVATTLAVIEHYTQATTKTDQLSEWLQITAQIEQLNVDNP